MRISDWSSDVCSSDLGQGAVLGHVRVAGRTNPRGARGRARGWFPGADHGTAAVQPAAPRAGRGRIRTALRRLRHGHDDLVAAGLRPADRQVQRRRAGRLAHRSEEHTSELQSLMRISYAVFCLKKKKQTTDTNSICNDKRELNIL